MTERRREGIVGGLKYIRVVKRRDEIVPAGSVPEQLQCTVGDHFVDVHVETGAGTTAERINDDAFVEVPFGKFAGGGLEGIDMCRFELPDFRGPGGTDAGELDDTVGMNQLPVGGTTADGKVLPGAQGVNPPEYLCREGTAAEKIVFLSLFHG